MILLLALAGCTERQTNVSASPQPPTSAVDHELGSSSISGSVVDPEARPLQGVEVAITTENQETLARLLTDENGQFTVVGLEAGGYILYARKNGFIDTVPKRVEVSPDEAKSVNITMQPLPPNVPFHETVTQSLEFTWYACVIVLPTTTQSCPLSMAEGDKITTPVLVDELRFGELRSFLVEMAWTPTSPACGPTFRSDVFSPQQTELDPRIPPRNDRHWADTNPFHWDNVPERVKSPTRLAIQREGEPDAMHSPERTALNGDKPIGLNGEWKVQVWHHAAGTGGTPVDYYCTVSQIVDSWTSTFYVQPAAADWSALP